MFFVLALLASTEQFKLTQCIIHNKITINIISADQTGPGSVQQAGPDRVDQGSARQGRAKPGRVEQSNATGQGREGPGRVKKDRTGSDRTGQGQTVPNIAKKVRTGRTGPDRIG